MAIEYFCCYHSYRKKIAKLSDEEVGRLFRSLLEYSETGETMELEGREAVAFDFIADDIDRAKQAYEAKCKKNRANGVLGGQANAPERPRTVPNSPQNKNKDKDKTKDKNNSPNGENTAPDGAAPTVEAKKSFGAYGWVKLTESEFNRLLNDFGQAEVNRCIAYVDESAQSSGNKNRWRDWNLVVRRCHRDGWGLSTKQGKTIGPAPKTADDRVASAVSLKKDSDWMDQFLAEQAGKEAKQNADQ